jgi:hypothetical protein
LKALPAGPRYHHGSSRDHQSREVSHTARTSRAPRREVPGQPVEGEIAPALAELVEDGIIRVIDMLFVNG